jgi:hypothetical protein
MVSVAFAIGSRSFHRCNSGHEEIVVLVVGVIGTTGQARGCHEQERRGEENNIRDGEVKEGGWRSGSVVLCLPSYRVPPSVPKRSLVLGPLTGFPNAATIRFLRLVSSTFIMPEIPECKMQMKGLDHTLIDLNLTQKVAKKDPTEKCAVKYAQMRNGLPSSEDMSGTIWAYQQN